MIDPREVARFRLPMPVAGMDTVVEWLGEAYGSDLAMRQDAGWLVVLRKCCDNGLIERLATPEEVDAGCELGIAFDPCPKCR